jgi:natural product precursor
MKKNPKKLRLNRETLALLDAKSMSPVVGGIETSCTYPCGCPTGCSDEQICMGTGAELAE